MDLEGIMLTEISQAEEEKYHMTSLICGIGKYSKGNRLNEKLGMEISMVFEGSGEDSKEMDLSEVLQVM